MLMVSAVLMILFLSLPLGDVRAIDVLPAFIVGVMSALFSLWAIFLFKHLALQRRLCLLAALFAAAVIVAVSLIALYQAYLYVIPALILDVWASMRIKADQNLLKSYDRIR